MNGPIEQRIEALAPALHDLFARVGAATSDGIGITRDAFGEKETAAAEILREFAQEQGLKAGYDRVGNFNAALPGDYDRAPEILIASHIDSVPRGGNYDGLAGVVAGLAVLCAARARGEAPRAALRVLGFRGEESPWFGTAYLGSRLFAGRLRRAELDRLRRADTGKTLTEHLRLLGVEPPGEEPVPALPLDRVRAYVELHIEQAPLLEAIDCPLGLATAIRGNIRHPFARCVGAYAHSAAVPRHLRSDAMLATAKLLASADAQWAHLIEEGHEDLVFTVGILHTDAAEHAMTKVPGEVRFSLNLGGTVNAVMEELHRSLEAKAEELGREHRVRFEFGERVGTPAVDLDSALAARIAASAETLGIPIHAMPTVGHDASVFARMGIPASVILVRNANGSHNPAEDMAMSDFMLGAKVLAHGVLSL